MEKESAAHNHMAFDIFQLPDKSCFVNRDESFPLIG
jgi:hypothetical protein